MCQSSVGVRNFVSILAISATPPLTPPPRADLELQPLRLALETLRLLLPRRAQPAQAAGHLSASDDKTVKLFNVNDGAVLRTFKHHTRAVYCLAPLPDGLRFVSGSHDKTARIIEIGSLP